MSSTFSYEFPHSFKEDLAGYAKQKSVSLGQAIGRCSFTCHDEGLAYYAGLKGDNWDKHAVIMKIAGYKKDLEFLKRQEKLLKRLAFIAIDPGETGLVIHDIIYHEVDGGKLPMSNDERFNKDFRKANAILSDIISIAGRMCNNFQYNAETKEDVLNDYFRDMLESNDSYRIKDQSRHGVAENNKNASGEVDILIYDQEREVALFEGMKLNSIDKNYISRHIKKAVNNYNALGTPTFIVSYVVTKDFISFWEKFYEYIATYNLECSPNIKQETDLQELPQVNASVKVAMLVISKDAYKMPLYFVAVKIN